MQATFRHASASKAVAAAENYTAGDVVSESASNGVGTAWSWTNLVEAGKAGRLVGAFLTCSEDSVTAAYRLHLFKGNPSASELDDNAALAIAAADQANYIGLITFAAAVDRGVVSSATNALTSQPVGIVCNDNTLYGILEDTTGETAETAGMTITIHLFVEQ